MSVNGCVMLSYVAPAVSDKPPAAPGRLTLERESAADSAASATAYRHHHHHHHRYGRPPSVTFGDAPDARPGGVREGFGVLPVAPVRGRSATKEDGGGGGKPVTLKRVSFGSSKGSMVETLIYDSPPVQEEQLDPSDIDDVDGAVASTKVRVSFFESEKPCVLPSPPKSLEIFGNDTMTTSSPILQRSMALVQTQISADGWENPFRPDGDLSKEADQIVELIKEGKPITPTPTNATSPLLPDHSVDGKRDQQPLQATSTPAKANGTRTEKNAVPPNVEVQRGTVINGNEPSQVEHVVLKKKPKCRCCVIQ